MAPVSSRVSSEQGNTNDTRGAGKTSTSLLSHEQLSKGPDSRALDPEAMS